MSWVSGQSSSVLSSGELRFVAPAELIQRLAEAEARQLLPVLLAPPTPAARGQLGLMVEEAIESMLMRRGACAPGVGASVSLEASLNDQLYRARLLELRGIALALPSLAGILGFSGALDPEDSAALRFWLDAVERAPLRVFLDQDNARIGVYGAPRPLSDLLSSREPRRARFESAIVAPAVAASAAAMEHSEPPPPVVAANAAATTAEEPEPPPAVVERDGALAFEQPLEDESPRSEPVVVQHGKREPCRRAAPDEGATPLGDITDAILQSLAEPDGTPEPAPTRGVTSPSKAAESADGALAREESPPIAVPPLFPNAPSEWRTWLEDLKAAKGPRPLSVIERMFVTSYVPLYTALLSGLEDEEAERAVSTWSKSFAESYREAFEALRVRGKRPNMVLDVPDVALRIGRLHGARSVQLLLIDGMRFDLGLRVEQRVRALVGQQAVLTDRLLLWSALPSVTEVQLELIGRGPEGLLRAQGETEAELPVARGRSASMLRRVRAGHRDLLKLDLVEARLSEPGAAEAPRLDSLADEVARVVTDYLAAQPPRTLVLAFGDHGFVLDALDAGTAAMQSGGSSPEEVLVPAFAWLVGGVH